MDTTQTIVGPGLFHARYIDFRARELGVAVSGPGVFDSFVKKLQTGEMIIRGDIESTVVVESEAHFNKLILRDYPPSFFYAVSRNGPLNHIMTTDNTELNAEELTRVIKEKESRGLFDYVRKEEGGRERKLG